MIRTLVSIVAVLSLPLNAAAQERFGDVQSETRLKLPTAAAQEPKKETSTSVRLKLPTAENVAALSREQPGTYAWSGQPNFQNRHRSVGRKIIGGAIGGVAGLFAGGYLGAKIEGDGCGCDDPGLQGALIGAPIGMIAGAILGAWLF